LAAGLLLNDNCACTNLSAADHIADLHSHKVTAPKLAIDSKVEQCTIPQAPLLIREKADLPDLLRFERSLRPHCSSRIPHLPLG
jgi:hypothetical protein